MDINLDNGEVIRRYYEKLKLVYRKLVVTNEQPVYFINISTLLITA